MLAKTFLLLAVLMLNLSFGDSYYLMCPLHPARESYCNCGQNLYVPMIQSRSVYGSQLNAGILPEQLWVVPAEDYEAEIPTVKITVLPAQPSSEDKAADSQTPTNHIVQPKLMPDVEVSWKVEENGPKSRKSVLDGPDDIKLGKLGEDSGFDSKEKPRTSAEESVANLTELPTAAEQPTSTAVIETTVQVQNTIEKLNEDKKTKELIKKENVEDTRKRRTADFNVD